MILANDVGGGTHVQNLSPPWKRPPQPPNPGGLWSPGNRPGEW
jgi:hypothetical protein